MSIISVCAASSHAQVSRVPDACEKCADELALAKAELASLKVQAQLVAEREKFKDDTIAELKDQRNFYKTAAESFQKASGERAMANETDALRIDLLRSQVAEYKIELDRARREVEKLRSSRKYWTLFGAAVGAAGTYAATK